jgi:hypothetical protein
MFPDQFPRQIFKIDATGTLTTIHSFGGATGGGRPWGTLTQALDGSFYGTTSAGGTPITRARST